ncbi:MAG: hypothetical protein HUU21_01765 [Polyangiaceae bacterium]|nr:hypothetical protein [Polyangiaceae bacterium]NUQ72261.1 hypothetical protein [Polyangiaceae bacterium]
MTKKSPAKRAARKAANTATRKTPEARAAAETRRAGSAKRGLLKAEFSEEAVKAVFVSLRVDDEMRAAPKNQPSPERSQPSPEQTEPTGQDKPKPNPKPIIEPVPTAKPAHVPRAV